jgi:prolyl oligopeptidase
MKPSIRVAGVILTIAPFWAFAARIEKPPAALEAPTSETLWGRKITDRYRYMESMGPETVAWMKAQGAYTRAVLDSIRPRAALERRIADFAGRFDLIQGYVRYGRRAFYEERSPGSDVFDLMVRDERGVRMLIDIAALSAAHGRKPYAINYFLVSPDGAKVAVGISEGGSEAASMSVYDANTGIRIAGPIDRADFGATAWSTDSTRLYFIRLRKLAKGESALDKYKNIAADVWDLVAKPVPIAGSGVAGSVRFKPDDVPAVLLFPGSPVAVLVSVNGAQNEMKLWTAPASQAGNPQAPWKLLADRDAQITFVTARGHELFLLSHKDAPNYQVLALTAGQPLSAAKVLVPTAPERVIEGLTAASDGLYVFAREGAYSRLLRVPHGSSRAEELRLPARGHSFQFVGAAGPFLSVPDASADPMKPGIVFHFSSWVLPDAEYYYDPRARGFTHLRLARAVADVKPADYVVKDLAASTQNGIEVPLTLIEPKGAHKPEIVYLHAYGSYGVSLTADFSPLVVEALDEGVARAECHVRGGGDEGESWYVAGRGANKHNSWQDLIACGEYLVAHGITSKGKLFIAGHSAGGIAIGRALTERPDLFAGAVDEAPVTDMLRFEFSPNGPPNVAEFGTVKTEQGFQNLYSMDPVVHVRKGVTYPAVLITTGLNDQRVAPWVPAKLAATLQASGSPNPVLLRVDVNAGHGIGMTTTQQDQLEADILSFIFWRAGRPAWQPHQ